MECPAAEHQDAVEDCTRQWNDKQSKPMQRVLQHFDLMHKLMHLQDSESRSIRREQWGICIPNFLHSDLKECQNVLNIALGRNIKFLYGNVPLPHEGSSEVEFVSTSDDDANERREANGFHCKDCQQTFAIYTLIHILTLVGLIRPWNCKGRWIDPSLELQVVLYI